MIVTTNIDGAPPNATKSVQGFVTMVDLTALLDKKRSKQNLTTFQFIYDRPYSKEILSKPYPKKYESLTFPQYDGRKELISGTILCFQVLSILGMRWLSSFAKNIFKAKNASQSLISTTPVNARFARLLDAAKRTSISVKVVFIGKSTEKPTEKKTTAHTLVVSVHDQGQGQKRRDHDTTSPPPISLIVEELDVFLDQWIANGAIILPQSSYEPSNDDKRNPKYCRYHRFTHHSTMDYFSLRRIYHHCVAEGLLEVLNDTH
ncbi:hypothetical protein SLEP1_g3683 [Rubroshorea leprosula]|uniref:Uncharacterized protein n=1 Tax=Rubroshorea leprosula TaxID=152421 RepID=A0AAV5HL77_9ROSI|nr:hypothetical protein SLEP1_g3683 [Rubroshorea leprosula]